MTYQEAVNVIVLSDGTETVSRDKWKSPKMRVTWSSYYTKFTGFRTPHSGAGWYPKEEDILAADWYVVGTKREIN